jgi:hypothetical protein
MRAHARVLATGLRRNAQYVVNESGTGLKRGGGYREVIEEAARHVAKFGVKPLRNNPLA